MKEIKKYLEQLGEINEMMANKIIANKMIYCFWGKKNYFMNFTLKHLRESKN